MENKRTTRNYFHQLVQGSPYEAGFQQGKIIKMVPGLKEYLAVPEKEIQTEVVTQALVLLNQYAPALIDEIQGMADALDVSTKQLIYLSQTYLRTGHCSQFIYPKGDGGLYHVRNYEFTPDMDDFCLMTTAVDGAYKHLGFSVMFLGRYDGINEHGLVMTMTASGIPVGVYEGMGKPVNDGLQFWVLVRLVMEQCKTVPEALALIREFPLCSNPNFLISDAAGRTALVETRGKIHEIAEFDHPEALVSTNHYTLPSMQAYLPNVMNHSLVRYDRIQELVQQDQNKAGVDEIKQFLEKSYPDGVNCHFYDEYFGTLRSMIFDPQERAVEICFGTPAANPWRRYTLDVKPTPAPIPVVFPHERTTPEFWQIHSIKN